MKIEFQALRMKNFLQVGNEFETFALNKNSFTAIVGKNGSGKSTLVDALTYVLFKKPFRKIKLSQLINNTNKKNMVVEIYFSIGNDKYLIKRGEKPKLFEIYKNDKLVDVDPSVNDYQNYLENTIIKQNYKTFCQINVISKAKYIQFMDLDTPTRRAIVEDLLDSNIFSVMQNLAKDVNKDLKQKISDLNTELTINTNKIENTNSILSTFDKQKQDQIQSFNHDIHQLELQNKTLQENINNISNDISNNENAINQIIPSDKIDTVNNKFTDLNKQIYEINKSIDNLNRDKSSIDSLTTCPKCLQNVDQSHKQHIVDDIDKSINEKQSQLDSLIELRDKIDDKLKQYNIILNKISELNRDLTKITDNIKNNNSNIERLNKQIDIIKNKCMPDLPDIKQLSELSNNLNKQIDDNTKQLNNYIDVIKLLGDDGIKAAVIQKYIPVINQNINQYLNAMQMYVEFTLDNEFNEDIQAINRDMFTYHSFSEGQKMRIDLAIMLTWRQIARLRNTMSTNLFILDEVADGSLDDDGMAEFLGILKSVADAQNTFIISHKDSTIDLFDNVIRVETDGNFSKYIKE